MAEFALRSARLTFDDWRARQLHPSASAEDFMKARAWLDTICSRNATLTDATWGAGR